MVFIDSSSFIANIWVLKNLKTLIFKQNNAFEQTHLKSGRGLFWNLLYLTEMCRMEDKKEIVFSAHFLSFSIFDRSKIPKSCFLTKIISLSRHSFEQWTWQVLDFTYRFMERYVVQDRKWLLFNCWISFQMFEDSKTRKFCLLYKTIRLSRHSFEKWMWPLWDFM